VTSRLALAAVCAIAAAALVPAPHGSGSVAPASGTHAPTFAKAPAPASPPARDTLRFSGSIHRAETFRHPIGMGLEFRLTPMAGESDGAWSIGVWPRDSVPIDYASVATPPYRGVNARDLLGWHFRNQDNTGPNHGEVNAPEEERDFQFVETRAAFDTCYAALQRVMWPYNYSDQVAEHASDLLDSLPTGSGTLIVTSIALTPPLKGAQAEIDSMRFEVTLLATRRRGPEGPAPHRAGH